MNAPTMEEKIAWSYVALLERMADRHYTKRALINDGHRVDAHGEHAQDCLCLNVEAFARINS